MNDPRIVVGVDRSSPSTTALGLAMIQARLVGATVEAISAWQDAATAGYSFGGIPYMYEGASIATITVKVLAETVAEAVGQPDNPVGIRTRVGQGHPALVLLDTAIGADMLVVGSRGHGPFAGTLLGPVSQHCVDTPRARHRRAAAEALTTPKPATGHDVHTN